MTYGYALAKNPCPWGHEINNFVRPFNSHHKYIWFYAWEKKTPAPG